MTGSLGNNASRVSESDSRSDSKTLPDGTVLEPKDGSFYRRKRFALRDVSRKFAPENSNVAKCGRVAIASHVSIRCQPGAALAHYHGLVHCGSVWACPICAWHIALHRAAEVRVVAERHREKGGGLYLLSLTAPHDHSDHLKPLRQAVSRGWRYVANGAPWKCLKESLGLIGSIRAMEATVGKNGWHPHLHVLVLTAKPLSADQELRLADHVEGRWSTSIERSGYRRPSSDRGVNLTQSRKDDYIAKMGLAEELTAAAGKEGRNGSRSPLRVLADYAETKRSADAAIWRGWTAGMKGARQLTWSRGLRALYLNSVELSDEEAAQLCLYEREESEIISIPASHWMSAVHRHPHMQWTLLEAAETGGGDAVERVLQFLDLPITRPWGDRS